MPTAPPSLPSNAVAALERGDKIGAIKHLRTQQPLSLKEAKDLVEAHLAANAGLRQRYEDVARSQRSGLFGVVLVIVLAAIGGWFLLAGP